MTVTADEIGALVGNTWAGTQLASPPVALSGGFWASMFRVEISGQPESVPARLVLRIAPDPAMGAKELAVQEQVAGQDYPTPRIHARGYDTAECPWALMDFVDGRPLLDGLDGVTALRRAPRLLRSLPNEMAGMLARLHLLDPTPVTEAVRATAPSVAWRIDDLLGHFEAGARALDEPMLADAVGRLADRRPPERRPVVCHGDFHPFNILTDDRHHTTVIDWTGALYAEPAFDLAFTALLLSNPPLAARGVTRSLVHTAGTVVARRFLARYRHANPGTDMSQLGWYQALHGVRILVEHARLENVEPGPGHPFTAMVGPATSVVGAVTGCDLSHRG